MNKRESNKLTMYNGVLQVLESNSAIYSNYTVMTEAVTDFKNLINEINNSDIDFIKATKGTTATKEIKEDELETAILKLANAVYIYATRTGNEELKTDSDVNRSRLELMRDTELANRGKIIIDKAESLLTELTGYGITQEFIDAAKVIHNDFETILSKQQEKHAERSMNRQSLTELYKQIDSIVYDQLDPFVEMFIDTEVDFYNEYKRARIIKNLGYRSKSEPEESGN